MPTFTPRLAARSGWPSEWRSWSGCGVPAARSRSGSSERAFSGAAHLLVDLPDGAHVIREVRDAGHHAVEAGLAGLARRAQDLEPLPRLAHQSVSNLPPRRCVDLTNLPGLVPLCVGE